MKKNFLLALGIILLLLVAYLGYREYGGKNPTENSTNITLPPDESKTRSSETNEPEGTERGLGGVVVNEDNIDACPSPKNYTFTPSACSTYSFVITPTIVSDNSLQMNQKYQLCYRPTGSCAIAPSSGKFFLKEFTYTAENMTVPLQGYCANVAYTSRIIPKENSCLPLSSRTVDACL